MTDATETLDPMVGPTMHRLLHTRGSEVQTPEFNRQMARRAWRIVPAVETMRKQGKITEGQWRAYERFDEEWNKAAAGPSVIAKYGERAGGGGTPVAHMTSDAFDAIERRDGVRRLALAKVEAALQAIGVPRLCKALALSVANECGLEQIGYSISRYTDRGKAIAVAAMALDDALWLLDQHYTRLYGQSQVAP